VKYFGDAIPVWNPTEGGGNWVMRYDRANLVGRDTITHKWELTLH
jgi:hypothetical protein